MTENLHNNNESPETANSPQHAEETVASSESASDAPCAHESVNDTDNDDSYCESDSEDDLNFPYDLEGEEIYDLDSMPTVSYGDTTGGALFSPGACFVCTGHVSRGGIFNVILSLLFLGFFIISELLEFFPLPGLLFLFILTIVLWIGVALGTRDKTKAMIPGGRFFLVSFSLVTFWFPVVLSMVVATNFVMQQTWMANDKMLPQIRRGDTVLVDRLSYKIHPVERGDLVLIQELYDDNGTVNRRSFFARVIALPGDLIQIKSGIPYVNNKPLAQFYPRSVIEDYQSGIRPHPATIYELPYGSDNIEPEKDSVPERYYPIRVSTQLFFTQTESLKLDKEQYFVLVDNRDDTGFSYIKTSFGSIVHETMIKGRPRYIVYNSVDGTGFSRFGYKLR